MKNKPLLVLAGIFMVAGLGWYFLYGKQVTIKTTLGGEICAVKAVGAEVEEGDPLLRVKAATGNAVAARSSVNGTICEVKVKIGEVIAPKTEVVVIKRNK